MKDVIAVRWKWIELFPETIEEYAMAYW